MYKFFTLKVILICTFILGGCASPAHQRHCDGLGFFDQLNCRKAADASYYGSGYAASQQQQYQNIQNNVQQITAPKIITPLPSYTNQNQNPFYQAPQQSIQPPVVNCVPNGMGGYRCQ